MRRNDITAQCPRRTNFTDFIVVCQLSCLAKAVHLTPFTTAASGLPLPRNGLPNTQRASWHLINKQLPEHLSFAQTVWSLHPGSKFQITTLSAQ